MNRNLKIALSAAFIALVAVLVVKHFMPRPHAVPHAPVPAPVRRPIVPAPAPVPKPVPAPTAHAAPRMAIVLDDWGNNLALVSDAVAVERPLTLAVIPKLKFSRRIAEEAHAKGLGVMLHMPMEPKEQKKGLEPHTIMTTSPDSEVLGYLDEAIAAVPYLEGVNNHMGSAATSDARVMRLVLARLKEKGLFFVDSHTISTTVAPEVAKEEGTRFASRNVFIDNVVKLDAVKEQLRIAVKYALKHGTAVVIGHDKKVTLEAIKEMVPEIESAGVRLVFVRELVKA